MTNTRRFLGLAVTAVCVVILGTGAALAADPVKVAPGVYKVALENDHVRVLEVTLKPGEKVPMHSHPACIIYPLNDSKTRFTSPDGKSVDVDMKTGAVSWHEAESHMSENIGQSDARVLVIEMKKHSKPHQKK
jgi:hypothetical protein